MVRLYIISIAERKDRNRRPMGSGFGMMAGKDDFDCGGFL
jgi:hypothetical protein